MDENLSFKKHGAGSKAARWARKHYVGKKYRYGINTHLSKRNPTYCSKLFIKHIDME